MDSSIDARAASTVAGYGVHSSKHMAMSERRVRWMRIDSSGERNTGAPSMGERKLAPSSLILRMSARLNTWNPPESVRMGRPQFMKRCSPACASITSRPGRRKR